MKFKRFLLAFLIICLGISSLTIRADAASKAPAAPVVSTSNSEISGKVQLSWKAVDGASTYKIYRSTSLSGTYSRITTTSSTSFVNTSTVTGTKYYYYVVAVDANGKTSKPSKTVSRTCALPRPVITLSNVDSSGKIKISWDAVDGASKYQVYRSTDGENFSRISTTSKTSLTNTSAVAGTQYYYKVKALHSNSNANSAFSKVKSRTCKLPRPSISAMGNSEYSGKITVAWDPVDGAASYKIYRSDTKNGTYSQVGSTAGTSFTNSSCETGKTYYYKIRAIAKNESANSAQSSPVSHICKLPQPAISLSNVSSSGKIKISWDAVDGAEKYEVYRSKDGGKNFSRISTTAKTSVTNSSAVAGTTYHYKVKALAADTDANSAFSKTKSRICKLPRPAITETGVSEYSGKIVISWGAVDGAVSYKIYRSNTANGTYSLVGSTTGTSFTNSSCEAGTTYYYKVRAVAQNEDASSAQSSAASQTCALNRPEVTLSNIASTGKIKISWKAVNGAVKYEVYSSKDGGNTFSRISSTTKTSVTNNSAVPGIKYYYKVRAIAENTSANSPFSAVRSRTCDLARPVTKITNMEESDYIRLDWDAIDGTEEYRVYRCTEKDGSYSRVAITTENSFIDTTALVDVTYFYKVTAYCSNTDGNSVDSEILSGVCSRMFLMAELNEDGKPCLTWNGVDGAESYAVYRSTGSQSDARCIATTQYTSLTNNGAAAGITYHYTVCALDADGNVLRESDNQVTVTTTGPENETTETNYVKGILLSLYKLPENKAEYVTVPYMTQVQLGSAISSSENGSWYRVYYKDELYYVWIEPGEDLFTTNGSTFRYTSDNPYQQEVIDLASYIALNWKTVYEHNASKGEMKPDGTYGFDCSGFVRYVMNTIMQQYVPTYKIVAEIEDLVVTENIYNDGYPGAFSAYEVAVEDIQPGDVIFFTQESENDHCGIYLGNGEFVHSSNYWENSVCISPLINSYVNQLSVVRRYLPEEVVAADTVVSIDPHNKDGSTTTKCKLYAERSTDSTQLAVLSSADSITVLFTDNDNLWAYVRLDDETCGWILMRNLGSPST